MGTDPTTHRPVRGDDAQAAAARPGRPASTGNRIDGAAPDRPAAGATRPEVHPAASPPLRARPCSGGDRTERRALLGWKASLVLDLVLLCLPIPLVVGGPAILTCRDREANDRFYAGESYKGCVSQGAQARWQLLDSRVKMLVRNSGR